MYVPYFIVYMVAGFVVSLAVLLWALRHNQFRDQERARYLPLVSGGEGPAVPASTFNRLEGYALLALAGLGLLAMAATLVFSLIAAP